MSEAAGKSGHVKEGANAIAGMKEWHLDYIANEGDITVFHRSVHTDIIVCLEDGREQLQEV